MSDLEEDSEFIDETERGQGALGSKNFSTTVLCFDVSVKCA